MDALRRLAGLLDEKRNLSPGDFQRAAADLDESLHVAYRKAHSLKAMWDEMEEIPQKQRQMYDRLGRILGLLDKPMAEAYQLYMELRRYR
jgi:hypothetical protein